MGLDLAGPADAGRARQPGSLSFGSTWTALQLVMYIVWHVLLWAAC